MQTEPYNSKVTKCTNKHFTVGTHDTLGHHQSRFGKFNNHRLAFSVQTERYPPLLGKQRTAERGGEHQAETKRKITEGNVTNHPIMLARPPYKDIPRLRRDLMGQGPRLSYATITL